MYEKRSLLPLHLHLPLPLALSLLAACVAGCPSTGGEPNAPAACDQPGNICTVAGDGRAAFNGDGLPATETSLYYPYDVVFDEFGRALVLDWNNLRLRRINDDGRFETIIGTDFEAPPADGAPAVDSTLHHASDVERDAAGRVYFAGNHAPVVFRIDLDQRVYVVAGSGEFGYSGDGGPATAAAIETPFGIALADDGSFYVSDQTRHVVRRVDASGVIQTVAGNGEPGYSGDGGPALAARLRAPTRLRLLPDGGLLICDTGNHCVRRVGPDGAMSTFAGTGVAGYGGDGGPAASASLDGPFDLALDTDGAVLVADTGNHVVRRIGPDGVISTIAGAGRAGFDGDGGPAAGCLLRGPSGVSVAPDGSLWICDTFNNRVRRVPRQ